MFKWCLYMYLCIIYEIYLYKISKYLKQLLIWNNCYIVRFNVSKFNVNHTWKLFVEGIAFTVRITEFQVQCSWKYSSYSVPDKRAWQKCHFAISTIGYVCATKWQKCVNDSRVSLSWKKGGNAGCGGRAIRSPILLDISILHYRSRARQNRYIFSNLT